MVYNIVKFNIYKSLFPEDLKESNAQNRKNNGKSYQQNRFDLNLFSVF
jgi:hypothetical protein